MTNIDPKDNTKINRTGIDRVINYRYLGQTIEMEIKTGNNVLMGI